MALALAGGLAIVFLLILFLIAVTIPVRGGRNASMGIANQIPIVGGWIASLIDNAWSTVYWNLVATSWDAITVVRDVFGWVQNAVLTVMAPWAGWVNSTVIGHGNAIAAVQGTANAAYNVANDVRWNWVPWLVGATGSLAGRASALEGRAAALEGRAATLEAWAAGTVAPALAADAAALVALGAALGAVGARVGVLEGYRPVLDDLRDYGGSVARDLTDARTRVGSLESWAERAQTQIDSVLPLSVVVALGLEAITNLVRIAEDPCYCLSNGDGRDLTALVEAALLRVM